MFVKMKPTCDCGFVFEEFTVSKPNYNQSIYSKLLTTPFDVSPSICPQCGISIEGIQYQVIHEGKFEYDVTKYNN